MEIKKHSEKKFSTEKEIQETFTNLRDRLKQRQKVLALSLITFFVVAASIAGFLIYNKSLTHKASQLEYEGYKIYSGQSQPIPDSPDNRYKNALKKFNESYNAKKNPRVLYYIANCHYEMGDYDEAIKAFKELVSRFSDPQIVSFSYYKTAMAYLRKNDTENAIINLKLILNLKDGVFQDMALIETAKIFESTGKVEEAKGIYRELIEKHPQSVFVSEAKTKLEGK